jgi:hypothetical protein
MSAHSGATIWQEKLNTIMMKQSEMERVSRKSFKKTDAGNMPKTEGRLVVAY